MGNARGWAAGLALLCGAVAVPVWSADPPAVRWSSTVPGGELVLRLDPAQLARLGLRPATKLDRDSEWTLPLSSQAGALDLALDDGAPTRVLGGRVELPELRFVHARKGRTPVLHLGGAIRDSLDLSLRDARGAEWLRIAHGMRSPVPADGFRLFTAEMRIGPALAAWLGRGVEGELFAGVSLSMPLADDAPALQAKSCAVPNWPGTPGFVADVILTNIDNVQVQPGRCRNLGAPGNPCDGPGGAEGEVILVPSATLRNSTATNAAEIPWYTKFTGNYPPYGNDQHPFLVWNLYRMDADGRLAQISRSGVKHAFATANSGCSEPCPNAHILGRGCSDLYDASSNDCSSFLAPRRDVIPSRGVWGRCGSLHDPDCDGIQGLPPYAGGGGFCTAPNSSPAGDGYSFRLGARESQIDPALHPGARWFLDAWYVVRDDVDIFNTMGSRELFPAWNSTTWSVGVPGPFQAGAMLDRWLALSPSDARSRRSLWVSSEGHVLVGVRVRQLPDLRWQYDYAVMNLDFSRPYTQDAEPNLRIIRNLGLSALRLDLRNGAVADSASYSDGDTVALNDWTFSAGAGQLQWSDPGAATLDWGQLVTLRVISSSAPGNGALRLSVAEAGTPAELVTDTWVPDAASVFFDGFE